MKHLAEFNIGVLRYDWEDPRVADFRDNLTRVFALAERTPGYVWHLGGDEMEAAQQEQGGLLGGNPRTASTLSVWEDVESLRHFTYHTLHKRFLERANEWYAAKDQGWGGHRLVMWHVLPGHRPTIAEAVERLTHLTHHGPSEFAFSWKYATTAT